MTEGVKVNATIIVVTGSAVIDIATNVAIAIIFDVAIVVPDAKFLPHATQSSFEEGRPHEGVEGGEGEIPLFGYELDPREEMGERHHRIVGVLPPAVVNVDVAAAIVVVRIVEIEYHVVQTVDETRHGIVHRVLR